MAVRTRSPYSTPGPYHTGLWLIMSPSGQVAFAQKNRLPPQGSGYKYYWLGASRSQVSNQDVGSVLVKLGASQVDISKLGSAEQQAWQRGFAPVSKPAGGVGNWITQNWPYLIPFLGPRDVLPPDTPGDTTPGDTTPGGRTRPGGDSGSGDSGGGISGKGAAGLAGATALAISDPVDFLKFIAWIFHPRNILRMVEFLTGIVLMAFGFHAAMQSRGESAEGFATSEGALSRSGLGRVARELAASSRREGGGRSGRRPQRPAPAPHTTRRKALRLRYERERQVAGRREKQRRKAS